MYDCVLRSRRKISIQQGVQSAVVQIIRGHGGPSFSYVLPRRRWSPRGSLKDANATFDTDSSRPRRLPDAQATLWTNVETKSTQWIAPRRAEELHLLASPVGDRGAE